MKLSLGLLLGIVACGAGLSPEQRRDVQVDMARQSECVDLAKTRTEADACTDKIRAERKDGGL